MAKRNGDRAGEFGRRGVPVIAEAPKGPSLADRFRRLVGRFASGKVGPKMGATRQKLPRR